MASRHGTVAHLLPQTYKRMVTEWLEEDCPSFDYGGFVVGESMAEAKLLGKSAVSLTFYFSLLLSLSDFTLFNLSPPYLASIQ